MDFPERYVAVGPVNFGGLKRRREHDRSAATLPANRFTDQFAASLRPIFATGNCVSPLKIMR
jgi:hypothetical protein